MIDLYLILHKVRGEPAFDIATKIIVGKEEGWIVPTSGHRAYPSWWMPLDRITINPDDRANIVYLANAVGIPDDWPDHYDAKRDNTDMLNAARNALMRKGRIGVAKPAQPTYRRR